MFLQIPKVAARWYYFYQLCHSLPSTLLEGGNELPAATSTSVLRTKLVTLEGPAKPLLKQALDARQSAASMASYVGLDVLIPDILGTSNNDVESISHCCRA